MNKNNEWNPAAPNTVGTFFVWSPVIGDLTIDGSARAAQVSIGSGYRAFEAVLVGLDYPIDVMSEHFKNCLWYGPIEKPKAP